MISELLCDYVIEPTFGYRSAEVAVKVIVDMGNKFQNMFV